MEAFAIRDLTFTYPEQDRPALDGLSLTVRQGDFFVLCGASGCGKSTLLRQLKSVLRPRGTGSGTVYFEGTPLERVDERAQSQRIGFVQQSPEDQLVTDKVWHELAFGLESLGYDTPTIRRRVAEMASFFGIQTWFYKDVSRLSGGQKQLLNLACVMVMQPSVLILDEPTAQLDPIAAGDFLATLGKINRELGTTVVLTEHRLDEVFPLATRAAVLEDGKLLCSGTPAQVGAILKKKNHAMFPAMPASMRVWAAVESELSCPVTVREGRNWLEAISHIRPLAPLPAQKTRTYSGEAAITARELWFRYEKDGSDVVKGLTLQVYRGEFLALLGGNGTGKTTSLKLLSGLEKPWRGSLAVRGRVGLLPQSPQALFVKKTAGEDLAQVADDEEAISRVVRLCRLEGLLSRHPYDLSGGEQQRLALAKILLTGPEILLLDEPTKALDAQFKQELGRILEELTQRGVTILMVSHDVEFCAAYAHRCALFFDGSVVADGSPRVFFSGNRFYTTAANRMAREVLPQAVTPEEIVTACGGTLPPPPEPPRRERREKPQGAAAQPPAEKKGRASGRTFLAAALILLCIPLTLWAGQHWFGGRQYYAISVAVLLETMLPFFLLFEGRKPQARELVVIAVLCAIGVAGRAFFYMLPQFKPVMALTVIAGAALGAETGFLVGSMTMLCSNMLFSQGPWTPWQMFAMGIIGFLAGVLFRKGALPRTRPVLCLFGFWSAVVLYGGLMNFSSAILWMEGLDWGVVGAYLLSGFPMDCVHGGATALFLWLAALPMLEKLERVSVKYGLLR